MSEEINARIVSEDDDGYEEITAVVRATEALWRTLKVSYHAAHAAAFTLHVNISAHAEESDEVQARDFRVALAETRRLIAAREKQH